MTYEQVVACSLLALVLYGSPGPATLSLSVSGATVGFRRSLPYVAGIVLGLLVNFLVALLGITALLQRAPTVVTVMKYLSLVYIVYLAVRMMRREPGVPAPRPLTFGEGVLLNLLNPKAYAAALAVLSQFGAGEPGVVWRLLGIVVGIGLLVDLAWCYGGSVLGNGLTSARPSRWLRGTLTAVLVTSVLLATFGS